MTEAQETQIREYAVSLGFTGSGKISAAQIKLHDAFRKACEANVCRSYGTNWQCPPALPPIPEIRETLKNYTTGLLFQTVVVLEDSFDFEGMTGGGEKHRAAFVKLAEYVKENYPDIKPLFLGAGGCRICKECTYLKNKPCIFPDKAFASVEGYGMDVAALTSAAGLKYNNGTATVSYVGLILY